MRGWVKIHLREGRSLCLCWELQSSRIQMMTTLVLKALNRLQKYETILKKKVIFINKTEILLESEDYTNKTGERGEPIIYNDSVCTVICLTVLYSSKFFNILNTKSYWSIFSTRSLKSKPTLISKLEVILYLCMIK